MNTVEPLDSYHCSIMCSLEAEKLDELSEKYRSNKDERRENKTPESGLTITKLPTFQCLLEKAHSMNIDNIQ